MILNVAQFIVNMRISEKTSTSVPRETNVQDQTNPENVPITSVSPFALLKAKIFSRNSKNID